MVRGLQEAPMQKTGVLYHIDGQCYAYNKHTNERLSLPFSMLDDDGNAITPDRQNKDDIRDTFVLQIAGIHHNDIGLVGEPNLKAKVRLSDGSIWYTFNDWD